MLIRSFSHPPSAAMPCPFLVGDGVVVGSADFISTVSRKRRKSCGMKDNHKTNNEKSN